VMPTTWACATPGIAAGRPPFPDDVEGVCVRCGEPVVWRSTQVSAAVPKICLLCATLEEAAAAAGEKAMEF